MAMLVMTGAAVALFMLVDGDIALWGAVVVAVFWLPIIIMFAVEVVVGALLALVIELLICAVGTTVLLGALVFVCFIWTVEDGACLEALGCLSPFGPLLLLGPLLCLPIIPFADLAGSFCIVFITLEGMFIFPLDDSGSGQSAVAGVMGLWLCICVVLVSLDISIMPLLPIIPLLIMPLPIMPLLIFPIILLLSLPFLDPIFPLLFGVALGTGDPGVHVGLPGGSEGACVSTGLEGLSVSIKSSSEGGLVSSKKVGKDEGVDRS